MTDKLRAALNWIEGFVALMGCDVEPATTHLAAIREALAQPQQPLSDEQIVPIGRSIGLIAVDTIHVARAIEAAHGITQTGEKP